MTDVAFAVNTRTFKAVFNKIYPTINPPFKGGNALGPIWLGVDAQIHVEGAADIQFEPTDTFLVKEFLIGWDKFILLLGFNLPPVRVGRFCILRVPEDAPFLAGECLLEFPGGVLFGGNPDLGPIKINLNAIITYIVTEISGRYTIGIRKDGAYQKVYADPQAVDVHPISVNNTFGKLPALLQAAVATASAQMLALIPEAWLVDVVLGILGFPTVTTYLLSLLDIGDDAEEWLMEKLNTSIGIDNLIYQAIFGSVLSRNELFKIDDPYPFVPTTAGVKTSDYGGFPGGTPATPTFSIPSISAAIVDPSVSFDTDQLNIQFDFGM